MKLYDGIEDVLQYVQYKGVDIHEKQKRLMINDLENKEVSYLSLVRFIDHIAQRKDEIGLRRLDKAVNGYARTPGGLASVYKDGTGKGLAYIKEKTFKDPKDVEKIGTHFYEPVRIDPGNEFVNMRTCNTLDSVKKGISAYFTSIIISEMNQPKQVGNDKLSPKENVVKAKEPAGIEI